MSGSVQKTVILCKLETTSGTDAAPTNTADAVLFNVSNLSCKISQTFADRDVVVGAFGAIDKLPTMRRGEIQFSVEMAGSGVAGTAPQWGDLLQACGMAETVTASTRVDYTPISTALKTATIWAYYNGRLEKFNYCAGGVKLSFSTGGVPKLDFTFKGLVSSVASAAGVTPTLTGWIRPLAVSTLNTTKLSLGAVTYSAGAITGGTQYSFKEFSADFANDIQDPALVGQEKVEIFGRSPTASLVADLGATVHAQLKDDMNTGTTSAMGLVHGTTAGNKILLYAPVGVITSVEDNVNGNVMLDSLGFTLRPSAGNDDLRLVAF